MIILNDAIISSYVYNYIDNAESMLEKPRETQKNSLNIPE